MLSTRLFEWFLSMLINVDKSVKLSKKQIIEITLLINRTVDSINEGGKADDELLSNDI